MRGMWMVLLVGLTAALGSCGDSDDGDNAPADCLQWQLDACEAYHACGMMAGVDSCSQHASEQCSWDGLQLNTSKTCNELTVDQSNACIAKIDKLCPTFEALLEMPACTMFMDCFGWPM